MRADAFFSALVARRWVVGLLLLGLSVAAAAAAARVPVDPSVERMHPAGDAAKLDFDRYRLAFPGEDTQGFVLVEGASVFTRAGLERLAALESALARLPHVRAVLGPTSAATSEGPLFPPETRATDEDVQASLAKARALPLSRAFLHPTRSLAILQVDLVPSTGAARIASERAFVDAARPVLEAERGSGLKVTLSGAPAVRATLATLVEEDMGRLLPLALLVILAIVAVAYRNVRAVVAAGLTLAVSVLWMVAGMAALDVPFGLLTSFAPIVILIVSLTDTVHVLSDFEARQRAGIPRQRALSEAMAHAAGPCLATEVVIAAGFLSMRFIGLVGVSEFGLASALGVLLAWAANMLVLPWVLSLGPFRTPREAEAHGRATDALLGWVTRQVLERPRRVVAVATLVLLASLASLSRLERNFRIFDDLRADSLLAGEIAYAEEAIGGLVPLAVFLEAEVPRPGAALAPQAMRFQRRAGEVLKALAERPPVLALPVLVDEVQRAFWGASGPLVETRESNQRALERLARRHPVDALVTKDRSAANVVALLPNLGSERMLEVVTSVRAELSPLVPPGYRMTLTGNVAMTEHVTGRLTRGLLLSFLGAVGVSFCAFFVVLRSARLALIGLVPNVLPLIVLFGAMPLLGISLKPSTVLIASMALVIADDDTLQFLLRFRRRFGQLVRCGEGEPHRVAALETLDECGRAMLVTSAAVAGGFLLLQLSAFEGIANLGLLTGLTLWTAGIADVFLTPLLLITFQPKLRT